MRPKPCENGKGKHIEKDNPMKWRFLLVVFLFGCLISISFFVVNKKNYVGIPIFSTHYAKIKQWLAKHQLHNEAGKQPKSQDINDDQPVHFEFYTTLPNQRVKQLESKIKNNFTALANANLRKESSNSKLVASLSPNELEQLLKEKLYVVQLGIFANSNSAERYQKKLAQTGLKTIMIKLNSNKKTMYRIQLGPFANLNEAKSLQKKLQKKGITTLIRKITNV